MNVWSPFSKELILSLIVFTTLYASFTQSVQVAISLIRLELLAMVAMMMLSNLANLGELNVSMLFSLFCVAVVDAVVGLALFTQMIRSSTQELMLFKL